ncbi:hypothetical protein [uncultured Tateyamaria sp.]|uniref:hypothetical protein n=1 Tax=uncultured Tateyamaria sp. TaxID=455651 RepID=UPI00262370E4|nr:hypothetical protein [uncultured Tateyamaria sp.]
MEEHARLIFIVMLVCGFVPILLMALFLVLTGRARLLFSKTDDAEKLLNDSPTLRALGKLTLWLFPVYVILLGVFAWLGTS